MTRPAWRPATLMKTPLFSQVSAGQRHDAAVASPEVTEIEWLSQCGNVERGFAWLPRYERVRH
jgi:hypothetical protein